MPFATGYVNVEAITAREAEVPAADFTNGMNVAGSNANGIGINAIGGAVVGTPEQFTLLDQAGDARTPQLSSLIGNNGLGAGLPGKGTEPVLIVDSDEDGKGGVTVEGQAFLNTLADGWVLAALP